MKVLSLFSGGGLGDYGLELAGMEIVGQVEIDDYCQKILKLRWPNVPKWRDIKNVTGKEILERCGAVDFVSGGFPCQPFSVAGTRSGEKDKRHLWPEMSRVIREVKPRWVMAENVPGLLSISNGRVFGEVVRNLAESGYDIEWDCIPASAVGAPHQRDRVWIVAYSNATGQRRNERKGKIKEDASSNAGLLGSEKHEKQTARTKQFCKTLANSTSVGCNKRPDESGKECEKIGRGEPSISSETLANTTKQGLERNEPKIFSRKQNRLFTECDWWKSEPNVGRVAHGVANRVDRLKLLGNGQVVQVVQWIGERIMEYDQYFEGGT